MREELEEYYIFEGEYDSLWNDFEREGSFLQEFVGQCQCIRFVEGGFSGSKL